VAEADDAVNAHMKFSLLDNLDINQWQLRCKFALVFQGADAYLLP
jgi:hypothetical protein